MRYSPENISVPDKSQEPTALAEAQCSAATWKALALRLAGEAQVCLDNAHWEVKCGSGDMLATLKAIRALEKVESEMPHNAGADLQPPRQ